MWSYDAWTRPLATTVWIIILITIACTAAVLRAVGHWEVRVEEGHAEEEDTWPAAITTVLSMVCAQVGSPCPVCLTRHSTLVHGVGVWQQSV